MCVFFREFTPDYVKTLKCERYNHLCNDFKSVSRTVTAGSTTSRAGTHLHLQTPSYNTEYVGTPLLTKVVGVFFSSFLVLLFLLDGYTTLWFLSGVLRLGRSVPSCRPTFRRPFNGGTVVRFPPGTYCLYL